MYTTRVTPVPRSEVPHLLSVRSRRAEISEGMWARVKSGTYKGDLAQVLLKYCLGLYKFSSMVITLCTS